MLKEKRHNRIVELVREENRISIAELSRRLEVSYMTVWRDLTELEQAGLIRRTRGGALSLNLDPQNSLETPPALSTLFTRFDDHDEKKIQIARYAATELIKDGDNIIVEAGSTASRVIPFLFQSNLTVLTNGLLAALFAVHRSHSMTLICSSGVLIDTGAFIGPQAEEFFSKFWVNKVFFGAQGVTLEDGFTDPTPLYIQLKCAMKRHAEQTIMLIDSSKFGVRSLVQVMSLDEVDVIVTDSGAPEEIIDGLRRKNIDVRIAPVD